MTKYLVHVERPDGKAGDNAVPVEAPDDVIAAQKALAATDPTFTVVKSVRLA